MSFRNQSVNQLKKGSYFMDGNEPCQVLSIEHSKAGKHGHAKNRITCIGLFDKKKRSLIFSSGSVVQVPEINKRTGQITDVNDDNIMVMDLESFETFEIEWPDDEVAVSKLKDLQQNPNKIGDATIEYWEILGKRIIQRVLTK
ncbi:MAG: translation initiation factor IF-5A [Promethearchaeota archaeon]